MIYPLIHGPDLTRLLKAVCEAADRILREERHAVAADKLRDAVIDLWRQVIGVSSEDDADAAVLVQIGERLLPEFFHVRPVSGALPFSGFCGAAQLVFRDAEGCERAGERLYQRRLVLNGGWMKFTPSPRRRSILSRATSG